MRMFLLGLSVGSVAWGVIMLIARGDWPWQWCRSSADPVTSFKADGGSDRETASWPERGEGFGLSLVLPREPEARELYQVAARQYAKSMKRSH